jgi:hypothetical protein
MYFIENLVLCFAWNIQPLSGTRSARNEQHPRKALIVEQADGANGQMDDGD